MDISAVSLTAARSNPDWLSMNEVLALARIMEEDLLHVFADLLPQAKAKKKGEEKTECDFNCREVINWNSSNVPRLNMGTVKVYSGLLREGYLSILLGAKPPKKYLTPKPSAN